MCGIKSREFLNWDFVLRKRANDENFIGKVLIDHNELIMMTTQEKATIFQSVAKGNKSSNSIAGSE